MPDLSSTNGPDRPLVAITAADLDIHTQRYIDAVERSGGEPWLLTPDSRVTPSEVIQRAGALVLTCGGHIQVESRAAGHSSLSTHHSPLRLTRAALDDDLPIYGICRGMQLLNVAMAGQYPTPVKGHGLRRSEGSLEDAAPLTPHSSPLAPQPSYHHIYISPGSKLAAVVGSGGFVRVNSIHHQGVREAQKSPRLLASAYSLDDGLIEALESPRHRWVIAVQFHPERRMEVPPHFDRLFQSLVERAAERIASVT